MPGKGPGALSREQGLRVEDERVRVPAAHLTIDHAVVRDDAKPSALRLDSEGPLGHEVRSAHVTGEEGRDDPQAGTQRRVGHGHELREGAVADRRRLRLKVFPEKEETDELGSGATDPRKVAVDLISVEAPPPSHGARSGPVVDADIELLSHAMRAPAKTPSYTRR